jgi:hypothetical protein
MCLYLFDPLKILLCKLDSILRVVVKLKGIFVLLKVFWGCKSQSNLFVPFNLFAALVALDRLTIRN